MFQDNRQLATEIVSEIDKLSLCIAYNLEYLTAVLDEALPDDDNQIPRAEIIAALTAAQVCVSRIPTLTKAIIK